MASTRFDNVTTDETRRSVIGLLVTARQWPSPALDSARLIRLARAVGCTDAEIAAASQAS